MADADRGPRTGGASNRNAVRSLVRRWARVLIGPRRFFRDEVVPGDQAPGLLFVMGVVLVEEATRLVLVPGAKPALAAGPVASGLLVLGVAVLLVAPLALHLAAVLITLALMAIAPDRRGVGETVQVVAYATAPCVIAGPPVPWLRLLVTAWGTALLVLGVSTVHRLSPTKAALAVAPAAVLVFWFGFRGGWALAAVLP